jgi:hypothetical protein
LGKLLILNTEIVEVENQNNPDLINHENKHIEIYYIAVIIHNGAKDERAAFEMVVLPLQRNYLGLCHQKRLHSGVWLFLFIKFSAGFFVLFDWLRARHTRAAID